MDQATGGFTSPDLAIDSTGLRDEQIDCATPEIGFACCYISLTM